MAGFALDLDVSYGWCSLHLQDGAREVRIRTHWLVDGLSEITVAVGSLLAGRPAASVRWPLEVSGGNFIDAVVDPQNVLHLAVSEFEFGVGAATADQIWSAARGEVLFQCSVPLADFVVAFVASLRAVRVRRVDSTGYLTEWRHSFPQSLYEALEREASSRFGYKPLAIHEIDAGPAPLQR